MDVFDKIRQIEYQTTKLKKVENGLTLKQFCDSRIAELVKNYPKSEHKIIDSIYNYFKNYMSFHAGDDLNLVSAWGYGAYNEIGARGTQSFDIVVKGGFSRLVHCIVDEIGKQNILLEHEVIEIDWNSLPISVKVKNNSDAFKIVTSNYVLITTPLGFLKANHRQLFVPNLPQKKIEAIERMGFGRVAKIFLYYCRPFWSRGTLENLKFARDDQQCDQDWDQDWSHRINGFEEVVDNPNVIQAWVSGEETISLEMATQQEIVERCTQLLRQFTGDPSIGRPDSVLKTEWCSNPFIGGSYSYPTTKTLANDHQVIGESLQMPNESEPRILFAGEATHDCYFSTVHGARLTGLLRANHIIKSFNKVNDNSFK
jgi:spermine oxidase